MSETEEIKDIGEVQCPKCKALVSIKRRIVYNQPQSRRKISEEIFAEESVQTTLET